MVRTVLRIVLLLIIVTAIAAFFIGYRTADSGRPSQPERVVGTTGDAVDADRARQVGARIGEAVADGANQARRVARDAALTAKIKSKMALDDTVKARDIDVDTIEGVVTLRGSVESAAQRERAVRLARDTEGVATVQNLLTIEQ